MIPDPRDVILAPVISEKSYGLIEEGTYTFLVRPEANKTEIKIAVEKIFNVRVLNVNTANRQGKRKRTRYGYGKRKDTKRALVSLQPGDSIEIFGGPVACRRPPPTSTKPAVQPSSLPEESDGYPQVQADVAGAPRRQRRRLRRGDPLR